MHTATTTAILDFHTGKEKISFSNPLASFLNWSGRQNNSRIFWSALTITSLGCVFAPITTIIISLSGLSVLFIVAVTLSMALSLVVNLAALSTRITIPVFLISVLVDLGIVIVALASGLNTQSIFAAY